MKSKAIEACRILNDILGDLVVGTRTIDIYSMPSISSQMSEKLEVGVTRLCIFHLIISLHKYIQFYKHYKNIIPEEARVSCKELMKILIGKKIPEFRNKVVGHIWDNAKKAPITEVEHDYYTELICGNDLKSFLLWINNPQKSTDSVTVVFIVEQTRNMIAEKYRIQGGEVFNKINVADS